KCKLDLRAGNVGSGAVCMYYLHLSDMVIEPVHYPGFINCLFILPSARQRRPGVNSGY
uniref:Uncharacterized protein n=1 Tax=Takifugu rubripes TaxID=31033 RepID=A0A3B5KA61_TAKRU